MSSGESFHPERTSTYKGGAASCPRCGAVIASSTVKDYASRCEGGLEFQLYAVCQRVPTRIQLDDGKHRIPEIWRFRTPSQTDLDAVQAAKEELDRLRPRWEAQDLIPTEDILEGEKTREPRNMGLIRWRDLFLPHQLLTNMVILEEICAAQTLARAELPEGEAEAVSLYLALMLSKVLDYNSVNTFWHTDSLATMHTFSRHDFAFRAAFCELESSRGAWSWAIK